MGACSCRPLCSCKGSSHASPEQPDKRAHNGERSPWPPRQLPPPGDPTIVWMNYFTHAAGPALRVGIGELILQWSELGGLFVKSKSDEAPPFSLHIVRKDAGSIPTQPLSPPDVCELVEVTIDNLHCPPRPYAWVPPEWQEFQDQTVIFDIWFTTSVTLNDDIGIAIHSDQWWSGLVKRHLRVAKHGMTSAL